MSQSHQNWQYLGASGYQGAYTTTGGGGTPIQPRSELDFLRLGVGRTPSAEYPDGYLGTMRSRRDDRGMPTDTLLDSLKNRQNQRGYQRGVHKGEVLDASSYFLPPQLQADRGLKLQARAKQVGNTLVVSRQSPKTALGPAPSLVNDGKANIKAAQPAEFNPHVSQQFAHLKPRWN
jgi:hypothetical protein